jgi:hypothetical protein
MKYSFLICLLIFSTLIGNWEPRANLYLSSNANAGAALIYGQNDWIYAFRGGNTNSFYYYDISDNIWYPAPNAPASVGPGGCLTSNWYCYPSVSMQPASHIWALRGGNTKDFWCFDLTTNSWITSFPQIPEAVNYGGSIAYGSDELGVSGSYWVYAIIGGAEAHPFTNLDQ